MHVGFNQFEELPDEKDAEITALKLLLKEKENTISELKKEVKKYKRIDRKITVEEQLEMKVVDEIEQCICNKRKADAKCDPYTQLTVSQQRVMEHEVRRFVLVGSDPNEKKKVWTTFLGNCVKRKRETIDATLEKVLSSDIGMKCFMQTVR